MNVAEIGRPAAKRPMVVDRLGVLIALLAVTGMALPFALFRANRIVPGEGIGYFDALPGHAGLLTALLLVGIGAAVVRITPWIKLGTGFLALAAILIAVGLCASFLTPEDNSIARVSPGAGFWLLVFAFALAITDALARLELGPWTRLALLAAVALALGSLLWSGAWNDLSILKEYANRSSAFWKEARTHLFLSFGSMALAAFLGIPLGIVCCKIDALRNVVLNVLNVVQTIPSIALFGLLIAPLAWVAANVPGAAAIGIAGIGVAPAMVALFSYSLLPIVSNTVVGILGVSPPAVDAARGMGMTGPQRMFRVELPLAFPAILSGIRIVLVQNIGLATIAALIGGGGFGVFVFQGIGQTAMDLVLLGAVPTVALAFAAAVVLDAFVDLARRNGTAP